MAPSPLAVSRSIVTLPFAAAEAVASFPRLVRALERLADPRGPLAEAAAVRSSLDDLSGPLESLSSGGGALDRLADVSTTLERLATLDRSLNKLGELGPTLARIGDLSDAVRQIAELEESLLRLATLAETMGEVQGSLNAIAASVAPLQGTAERLGRIVDRMPSRSRRTPVSVEPPKLDPGPSGTAAD